MLSSSLLFTLLACGSGDWVATTWGESYIEEEIPSADFADGCSVVYDTFTVNLTEASLLDGDLAVAGAIPAGRFDVTEPGPQTIGSVPVTATHYDTTRFVIASDGSESVRAAGVLTCGSASASFDWSFDNETTYRCEPDDLTVPAGGEAETQLTIHGDHLFYSALEDPDALLRGEAILSADGNKDGAVTLDELATISVAEIGYSVGQYASVEDLAAFVSHLTQTLGHVDGEGHCQVDL